MSRPNTPFLPLIGQEDAGPYLNHKLIPSLQKILGSVAQQSTNATQSISLIGHTSGATAITGAQLYFAGGNNITLSGSSNSITISAAAGAGQFYTLAGNTAGVSTVSGNQIFLAGGNNVTLSGSAGSITVSGAPVGSFGVSSLGNTAGTTGTVSNQIVLVGGSNVTLSQSTNATGATVTINGGAGGGGNVSVNLAGNTSGTTSNSGASVLLAGGNNITLSGDGTQVTISGAAQTNQTGSLFAASQSFGTSSGTYDARTLSIKGSGAISVAASNGGFIVSAPAQSNENLTFLLAGNTVGTSSGTGSSILLAGGNNVTLSGDGTQFTIVAAGAAAGVFAAGVSTGGNTAGNTGVVQTQLVFVGGNNITLSQDTAILGHGTVTISAPNQSNQAGSIFAVGNTFGTSSGTADARTLSISGAGNVSVAASNSGMVISGPQTVMLSFLESPIDVFSTTGAAAGISNSLFLNTFLAAQSLSFCRVDFNGNISAVNGVTASTASSGTNCFSYQMQKAFALFSLGTGTNSTAYFSMASTSWSFGVSNTISVSSTGAGGIAITQSWVMNAIGSIDSAGGITTIALASSTTNSTTLTSMSAPSPLSRISGVLAMPVGWGTSIPPGNYLIGELFPGISTTSSGVVSQANPVVWRNVFHTMAAQGMGQQILGQTTSEFTTNTNFPGEGVYSTTTAGIPSKIAFGDIIRNNIEGTTVRALFRFAFMNKVYP